MYAILVPCLLIIRIQPVIIVTDCTIGTKVQPSVFSTGPVFDDNLCV